MIVLRMPLLFAILVLVLTVTQMLIDVYAIVPIYMMVTTSRIAKRGQW